MLLAKWQAVSHLLDSANTNRNTIIVQCTRAGAMGGVMDTSSWFECNLSRNRTSTRGNFVSSIWLGKVKYKYEYTYNTNANTVTLHLGLSVT